MRTFRARIISPCRRRRRAPFRVFRTFRVPIPPRLPSYGGKFRGRGGGADGGGYESFGGFSGRSGARDGIGGVPYGGGFTGGARRATEGAGEDFFISLLLTTAVKLLHSKFLC